MVDKVWKIIHRGSPSSTEEIVKTLLKNRGIITKKDKETFLNPLASHLFDIDLPGISEAILRIRQAIERKERVVVYADYDCDGICGTGILWETLSEVGAQVLPHIPHRIKEGYGLSKETIEKLAKEGTKLIITVDQGITAREEVDFARSLGVDVIVTDHHIPPKKLPKAIIVHTTKLCGSGVSFLLSAKILKDFGKGEEAVFSKLDLATIATIADMVPLVGPNRAIVKIGLPYLRETKRPGLLALYKISGIKPEKISAYEISHVIAPRINAMGRIGDGIESLRLLLTKSDEKAKELAKILQKTNSKRQKLTEENLTIGKDLYNSGPIGIIIHENFHEGIIGLIAQKLVEEFYKPMVVIAKGQEFSKGSARSVGGFNIIETLRSCEEHLVEVGGHPMAAGFKIETKNLGLFSEKLEKVAALKLEEENVQPIFNVDLQLTLEHIDVSLLEELQRFSPFGVDNPEPIFISYNLAVEDVRLVGATSSHLKLQLGGNPKSVEAIGFGFGERAFSLRPGMGVTIVYGISKDGWNGGERIVLKIKDFRSDLSQN